VVYIVPKSKLYTLKERRILSTNSFIIFFLLFVAEALIIYSADARIGGVQSEVALLLSNDDCCLYDGCLWCMGVES